MKKKLLCLMLACTMTLGLAACGSKGNEKATDESAVEDTVVVEDAAQDGAEEGTPAAEEESKPGYYRSELTNEWIDESLVNQRPLAIMVDNELYALDHYGTSTADIVYEMMNSTQNGRITRFMCIVKDWKNIERFGSIRSTRTTNLQIAPEYNAVVIHDGGPFYIDAFLKNPYLQHISGGFARIENGKSREFTEYVTNSGNSGIESKMAAAGIDENYTQYYQGGSHFQFASESNPVDLSTASDAIDCNNIALPFQHNSSKLEYMPETGTYRYSEYGKEYIDALNDNHMEFKNVIIQECTFEQYDDHGYMNYFVTRPGGMHGYYITDGKAIPVTWTKPDECTKTQFYDANGNEIVVNTGKTYIAIVPSDVWDDLVIK